jgi:hypothetical protein
MGKLCCAREHSVQFFVQFFYTVKCIIQLRLYGAISWFSGASVLMSTRYCLYSAHKMNLFCKGQRLANSNIILTYYQSFCTKTFSASLTKLTLLLLQSRDSSCYVNRPILAPPPLWPQKQTALRAHQFAQSPDFWHQHRLSKITGARSWRICGTSTAIFASCVRLFIQNEDSLLKAR